MGNMNLWSETLSPLTTDNYDWKQAQKTLKVLIMNSREDQQTDNREFNITVMHMMKKGIIDHSAETLGIHLILIFRVCLNQSF